MDPSSSLSTSALFADLGLVLFALFLVLLNGFFVAAEFAMVKLRSTKVEAIAEQNGWRGHILRTVHNQLDAYLSACQLGITLASLAIGWLGEPAVSALIAPGLTLIGLPEAAIHAIAEAQKAGGIAAFIDAEHALDVKYAKNLGVDTDNLLVSQPDFGEQALEIVETLARSGAVDVIVVDSVAALTPKAEIEGDMGDSHMGLQARLMSQALRKLAGVLHKMNTTVIFINQIRQKIGGMSYGNNETTTGGNALKFYASVRVDIRKIQSLKQGEDVIGNRVKAKVIKNKVAPPFRQAEFDIMFGEGISRTGEIVDYGVKLDVIDKAGAWFSYKSTKIGQGRENAKIFLKDNSAVCQEIENEIRNSIGLEGDLPSLSDDISTGDDE